MISFTLGCIPKKGIAGSQGSSLSSLLRKPNCFPKWLHHFAVTLAMYESSIFSSTQQQLLLSVLFTLVILVGVKEITMIMIALFLKANDVMDLFICLLAICISSLEKCVFRSFAHS